MIIQDINKKYNQKYVLKNITFTLDQGHIIGIIGKNGAGKTTLLKILNGNIPCYNGKIRGLKNKKIASLIEKPKLYENKTGMFNLKYFLKLHQQSVNWKLIEDLISEFHMEKYINRVVHKYSMGMKQLLSLVIAISQNPDFLILDEPTNGMDAKNTQKILEKLTSLTRTYNTSIIITSHKLEEIEQICEKVLIIEDGKINKNIDLNKKEYQKRIGIYLLTEDFNKGLEIIKNNYHLIYTNKDDAYIECKKIQDKYNLLKDLGEESIYPREITEDYYSLEKDYLKD